MNDAHFAGVLALGRVHPSPEVAARALAALEDGTLDGEVLLATVRTSKVSRLALRALDAATLGPRGRRLRELLVNEVADDDGWWARAMVPTRAAVACATTHGGRVIKGLALHGRYPPPGLRHVGDADVQFPTWSGALPAVRALRAAGWAWDIDECPWIKWHESGVVYGQVPLVYPDATAPVARVDLHVGPFSVRHAAVMPLTGWRPGVVLGDPATVPNDEVAIAIVAAHAEGDGLLSVKDVNDVSVLASCGAVDWLAVFETCRSAGAERALAHIAATVAGACAPCAVPDLGSGRPLSPVRPVGRRRGLASGAHAYRNERARGVGAARAAVTAWDACRSFGAEFRPGLARRPLVGPEPRLRRRDVCWRLLPEATWRSLAAGERTVPPGPVRREAVADGLEWVRAGRGGVIVLDDSVFVPTVWGAVHADSVRLAAEVAGAAG